MSLWTPISVTVIIAFAFGCAAKGCCIPFAVLYFVLSLLPGQLGLAPLPCTASLVTRGGFDRDSWPCRQVQKN